MPGFTPTTMVLTPALLHALGEGVARLRDGDLSNRAEADEVCNVLAIYGYRHTGYNFRQLTPADLAWDTVCEALRSYAPDPGEPDLRIPLTEQEPILRLANGFGPGVTDPDLLWDWSHVRDSSEPAILAMAQAIQTWREQHRMSRARDIVLMARAQVQDATVQNWLFSDERGAFERQVNNMLTETAERALALQLSAPEVDRQIATMLATCAVSAYERQQPNRSGRYRKRQHKEAR